MSNNVLDVSITDSLCVCQFFTVGENVLSKELMFDGKSDCSWTLLRFIASKQDDCHQSDT